MVLFCTIYPNQLILVLGYSRTFALLAKKSASTLFNYSWPSEYGNEIKWAFQHQLKNILHKNSLLSLRHT